MRHSAPLRPKPAYAALPPPPYPALPCPTLPLKAMMRVVLALALARDAAAQWGVSVKGPTIPAGCTRWNDVTYLSLPPALPPSLLLSLSLSCSCSLSVALSLSLARARSRSRSLSFVARSAVWVAVALSLVVSWSLVLGI